MDLFIEYLHFLSSNDDIFSSLDLTDQDIIYLLRYRFSSIYDSVKFRRIYRKNKNNFMYYFILFYNEENINKYWETLSSSNNSMTAHEITGYINVNTKVIIDNFVIDIYRNFFFKKLESNEINLTSYNNIEILVIEKVKLKKYTKKWKKLVLVLDNNLLKKSSLYSMQYENMQSLLAIEYRTSINEIYFRTCDVSDFFRLEHDGITLSYKHLYNIDPIIYGIIICPIVTDPSTYYFTRNNVMDHVNNNNIIIHKKGSQLYVMDNNVNRYVKKIIKYLKILDNDDLSSDIELSSLSYVELENNKVDICRKIRDIKEYNININNIIVLEEGILLWNESNIKLKLVCDGLVYCDNKNGFIRYSNNYYTSLYFSFRQMERNGKFLDGSICPLFTKDIVTEFVYRKYDYIYLFDMLRLSYKNYHFFDKNLDIAEAYDNITYIGIPYTEENEPLTSFKINYVHNGKQISLWLIGYHNNYNIRKYKFNINKLCYEY